ncbi:MAG: hypothetical protein KAI94_10110, partial [Anaerolineales bacterium]|nr:hypothetical protein [Anaerolineales bacterium]
SVDKLHHPKRPPEHAVQVVERMGVAVVVESAGFRNRVSLLSKPKRLFPYKYLSRNPSIS